MDKYEQKANVNSQQEGHVCSEISRPQAGFWKSYWQQFLHRWGELLFDHKEQQGLVMSKIYTSLEILGADLRMTKIRERYKRHWIRFLAKCLTSRKFYLLLAL